MSEQNYIPSTGSLKISQDVIASIAGYAAADTEGVASLAPVSRSISGLFREKQPLKPISIQLEDGVAVIVTSCLFAWRFPRILKRRMEGHLSA